MFVSDVRYGLSKTELYPSDEYIITSFSNKQILSQKQCFLIYIYGFNTNGLALRHI